MSEVADGPGDERERPALADRRARAARRPPARRSTIWSARDDAEVVVGHERERAAALRRAAVEHDRAGLRDRERAAGEGAVEGVEVVRRCRPSSSISSRPSGRQSARADPARHDQPPWRRARGSPSDAPRGRAAAGAGAPWPCTRRRARRTAPPSPRATLVRVGDSRVAPPPRPVGPPAQTDAAKDGGPGVAAPRGAGVGSRRLSAALSFDVNRRARRLGRRARAATSRGRSRRASRQIARRGPARSGQGSRRRGRRASGRAEARRALRRLEGAPRREGAVHRPSSLLSRASRAARCRTDPAAQVHEHPRDVDLHRADLVAGPAQGRRERQRAALRRARAAGASGSLRSARDRPTRTRARRRASRPGRRSGRPSSGCSAAPGVRPRRRARRCARCRAAPGGTPAARRRARTPVQNEV